MPRSREIDSFFYIRWLAKCGYLGADPAKFSRSRILQSDKIGRNSMQFFSRGKSNPKQREHVVTNFSLSQKRLRILRRTQVLLTGCSSLESNSAVLDSVMLSREIDAIKFCSAFIISLRKSQKLLLSLGICIGILPNQPP